MSGWTPKQAVVGAAVLTAGYAAGHAVGGLGWSWPAALGAAAAGGLFYWWSREGEAARWRLSAKVKLKLPFGLGDVELTPDTTQRDLAWWIFVEARTRVVTAELGQGEGDLGVALDSLYKFFTAAREELRKAGPKAGVGPNTIGGTVMALLNQGLRPFMSHWHPLYDTQVRKGDATDATWEHAEAFRAALKALQADLETYLDGLADYLPAQPRKRLLPG
ncbi:MAG: hypothetical protein KC613_03300 [Myxococcales bacterium]|nr:hypothetical protein [Myxococcales bacterium]MCB9524287.1 hypothetical protein [Myxococcales bacterium]